MDRNHYRKLHGRQGVVERNWQRATHTPNRRDKRVTPRAPYVKQTSGGHTLGRSDRPHATASIDPKGYGRMTGTVTDRSVQHPWVLLESSHPRFALYPRVSAILGEVSDRAVSLPSFLRRSASVLLPMLSIFPRLNR